MSKLDTPKAIAFIRTGSRRQMNGISSLDNQKLQIMGAAYRHGFDVAQWFEQLGSTPKVPLSKRIGNMLDYCKAHPEIKYLVVTTPDRLTRSVTNYFVLKNEFEKLGVAVVTAHSSAELESPMREFIETLMITLAQMENRERSRHAKEVWQRRKANENEKGRS